jgi:glutaminyl-peptide cyclotransferase
LTWQNGEAFIYDKATFEKKGTFRYDGEGWGLATDGRRLILSDGTATLRFLDPATHAVTGTLAVTDAGLPVAKLNELEMVGPDLLANVWQTPRIARISLRTGRVVEWLDLSALVTQVHRANPGADVLNGIAWDAQGKRLFVTGKLWPNVYEIR